MNDHSPNGKFLAFWETIIRPDAQPELVEHWRRWVVSGVERGSYVVARLQRYRSLSDTTVLDIGCGYGGATIACCLADAQVIGFDPDSESLKGARIWARDDHKLSGVTLCGGEAEALPFSDSSVDIVICDNVLEHVNSHRCTVAEVARVLRPGGLAYFSFPSYLSFNNFLKDPHYGMLGVSVLPPFLGRWYVVHLRKRTARYDVGVFPIPIILRRMLKQRGLRVLDQEPVMRRSFGWLTPVLREIRTNTLPVVTWVALKES